MNKTSIIKVQGIDIAITKHNQDDYICLTDMIKAKDGESRAADIIKNWIRNRSTIEFLGTWESFYNPDFKVVEFDHFRKESGLPTFTMSVNNWVDKTSDMASINDEGNFQFKSPERTTVPRQAVKCEARNPCTNMSGII